MSEFARKLDGHDVFSFFFSFLFSFVRLFDLDIVESRNLWNKGKLSIRMIPVFSS
jgi:hypothetical protein